MSLPPAVPDSYDQACELILQLVTRARATPPEDVTALIEEFAPLFDYVFNGP